jgi:Glycosyltransferase family 10 (fucosyltransferase) C-term
MVLKDSQFRVKFVTRSGTALSFPWAGQCPGGFPRWERCEFIADQSCRNYDWFVALDDVPRTLPGNTEKLACPRSNTILVTSEPSSVTRYGKAFAAQFGTVLTNQEEWALPHPNAIRSQTGNIWFYGKSFEEIRQAEPPEKSAAISTVCSSKRQAHTMHARRYDFTQALKTELPELEIFGHGVRFIERKADALDPYRFHVIVENHIAPHHWTEKLADAFLGFTVPIYCGCPNVFDYFPAESVIPIDIGDFPGALATIRRVLATPGEYERRLPAITEARRRVIHDYNLPAMIHRIVTSAPPAATGPGGNLYGRRAMRLRHPADLVRFTCWRAGNLFQKLGRLF